MAIYKRGREDREQHQLAVRTGDLPGTSPWESISKETAQFYFLSLHILRFESRGEFSCLLLSSAREQVYLHRTISNKRLVNSRLLGCYGFSFFHLFKTEVTTN